MEVSHIMNFKHSGGWTLSIDPVTGLLNDKNNLPKEYKHLLRNQGFAKKDLKDPDKVYEIQNAIKAYEKNKKKEPMKNSVHVLR